MTKSLRSTKSSIKEKHTNFDVRQIWILILSHLVRTSKLEKVTLHYWILKRFFGSKEKIYNTSLPAVVCCT